LWILVFVNPELHKLLEKIQERQPPDYWSAPQRQAELLGYVARIHVLIAEEQAKSAQKLERQTNKLIVLTWALVIVSIALLAFALWQTDILKHDSDTGANGKYHGENQSTLNTNSK
jgi:hypothetical protein